MSEIHWKTGRSGLSGKTQSRALKLVEELRQQLKRGRITSGMRTVRFEGAVITAMINDGVPSLYVQETRGGRRQVFPPDPRGFVVTASSNDDELEGSNPEQLILPPGEDDGDWTVLTYEPIDGADPGRSDGTYKTKYPGGLRLAGNIDWLNARGVRLNWYGPSRRYWYDCWRKPDKQYNRFVFINGVVLLDTSMHAATEQYVLGAALAGNQLYVMQADINDFEAFDDTHYPAPRNYAWLSDPYPQGTTALRLCRYLVTENPNVVGNAGRLRVAAGSQTSLWSDTRRGYVNPWFFSPDGLTCETFAMPDELRDITSFDLLAAADNIQDHVVPSTSSENAKLVIDPVIGSAALTITTVSVVPHTANGSSSSAPIAVDYGVDGTRKVLYYELNIHAGTGDPNAYFRINDDPPVPVWDSIGPTYLAEIRHINIRDGLMVSFRAPYDLATSSPYHYSVGVYVNGVEVAAQGIEHEFLGSWPNHTLNTPEARVAPTTLRGHDSVSYWVNSFSTRASVSPLMATSGVTVRTSVQGRPTTPIMSTIFFWCRGATSHYEAFITEELHGYSVYCPTYQQALGASPPSSFMVSPAGASGVLTGMDALYSSASFARPTDANGMRVAESASVDADGNALVSVFLPLVAKRTSSSSGLNNVNNFYRHPVMVSISTGPDFVELTGIAGEPGPARFATRQGDVYDARYSTIWQLGAWPKLTERFIEE